MTIPNAVGMTGLLGYGGAYKAIHGTDLLLISGQTFRFRNFFPATGIKRVSDRQERESHYRTAVSLPLITALVGDIKTTVAALLPKVREKRDSTFLERHVAETNSVHEL